MMTVVMFEIIKLSFINGAIGSAGATSFLSIYYLIRFTLGVYTA